MRRIVAPLESELQKHDANLSLTPSDDANRAGAAPLREHPQKCLAEVGVVFEAEFFLWWSRGLGLRLALCQR
jgi:hypothetical protein